MWGGAAPQADGQWREALQACASHGGSAAPQAAGSCHYSLQVAGDRGVHLARALQHDHVTGARDDDQLRVGNGRLELARHPERRHGGSGVGGPQQLLVTLGSEERTVVAGIADAYEPDTLVGRSVVIVANLKPAKLMGIESKGMVLAASPEGGKSLLLTPDGTTDPGTRVR